MNRKGYSTGFGFVIGIILIFTMGLLYLILNQVMTVHLVPQAQSILNTTTLLNQSGIQEAQYQMNKYNAFWIIMPTIIFISIILWMILNAGRAQNQG